MRIHTLSYAANELIPVAHHLQNRKLQKYFNRETSVAIVCVSQLLAGEELSPTTPFYYAAGLLAYEEYGLSQLVQGSLTSQGHFSSENFVAIGIAAISPLTSFKILPNMTLAFISIEHQLVGDNAVVYISAASLLTYARLAPTTSSVLLGAGRVDNDGQASATFALVTKQELTNIPPPSLDMTALSFLHDLPMEKTI